MAIASKAKRLKRLTKLYSKMTPKELANHPQAKRMKGEAAAQSMLTGPSKQPRKKKTAAKPVSRTAQSSTDAARVRNRLKTERKMGVKRGR